MHHLLRKQTWNIYKLSCMRNAARPGGELQWALISLALAWAFFSGGVPQMFTPCSWHCQEMLGAGLIRRPWSFSQNGCSSSSTESEIGAFLWAGNTGELLLWMKGCNMDIFMCYTTTGALRSSEDRPYVWPNTVAKSTEKRLGNMLVFHREKKITCSLLL